MLGYAIDATSAASAALTNSLEQLARLLETTSDEAYVWRPGGGVSGSIGAHVRHVLDHVRVLVDCPQRRITYDRRERNTEIEHHRLEGIAALRGAICRLGANRCDRSDDDTLVLETLVERDQPPIAVATTRAREMVFALQHTIHHQAIIAVLLHDIGISTPAQFGYAPSTPSH